VWQICGCAGYVLIRFEQATLEVESLDVSRPCAYLDAGDVYSLVLREILFLCRSAIGAILDALREPS
jgi:hypothetical protein